MSERWHFGNIVICIRNVGPSKLCHPDSICPSAEYLAIKAWYSSMPRIGIIPSDMLDNSGLLIPHYARINSGRVVQWLIRKPIWVISNLSRHSWTAGKWTLMWVGIFVPLSHAVLLFFGKRLRILMDIYIKGPRGIEGPKYSTGIIFYRLWPTFWSVIQ